MCKACQVRKADPGHGCKWQKELRHAVRCLSRPDGSGNQALGAPRLNDDIWLYGGEPETIRKTLTKGRNGNMPRIRIC